jgi:hypothetical protein
MHAEVGDAADVRAQSAGAEWSWAVPAAATLGRLLGQDPRVSAGAGQAASGSRPKNKEKEGKEITFFL